MHSSIKISAILMMSISCISCIDESAGGVLFLTAPRISPIDKLACELAKKPLSQKIEYLKSENITKIRAGIISMQWSGVWERDEVGNLLFRYLEQKNNTWNQEESKPNDKRNYVLIENDIMRTLAAIDCKSIRNRLSTFISKDPQNRSYLNKLYLSYIYSHNPQNPIQPNPKGTTETKP